VWIQNIKVHTAPRYPQVCEVPQVRPATEALVGRRHHHHHHQNQCQCNVGSVGAICIIIFWWWVLVLVLVLWLLMLLVILLLLLLLLLIFPRKPPALPTKRLITNADAADLIAARHPPDSTRNFRKKTDHYGNSYGCRILGTCKDRGYC
jgi:hypothetical protein